MNGPKLEKIGSYTIVEYVGEGFTAWTWKAIHPNKPSHLFAIKLIKPNALSSKNLMRIERETRTGRLNRAMEHHLVPILEANEISLDWGTSLYMVSPFIGPNLEHWLSQRKSYNEADIQKLLSDLLKSLRFLHSNNILHRDIHPGNILCNENGFFLCDFGLVRNHLDITITDPWEEVGARRFTDPEVISRGEDARDESSDICSLGMVAYYAIVGELPHAKKVRYAEYYDTLLKDGVPLPKEKNPQCSEGMNQIIGLMVRNTFGNLPVKIKDAEILLGFVAALNNVIFKEDWENFININRKLHFGWYLASNLSDLKKLQLLIEEIDETRNYSENHIPLGFYGKTHIYSLGTAQYYEEKYNELMSEFWNTLCYFKERKDLLLKLGRLKSIISCNLEADKWYVRRIPETTELRSKDSKLSMFSSREEAIRYAFDEQDVCWERENYLLWKLISSDGSLRACNNVRHEYCSYFAGMDRNMNLQVNGITTHIARRLI